MRGSEPLRILVVDDDLVDRMAVHRALASSDLHLHIQEAESCREAIAALASGEFDCVLLDYFLPDGDGLSLLHSVRATGNRTPVIILTAQGDERIAVDLMKAGAADYLPKAQATADRLTQALRSALRIHAAEMQASRAEDERARLFALEQASRAEAEAAQARLAFLAESSTLLSSSLDYATTLETVARLAIPALADWCFVDLAEKDGGFRRIAVAHRSGEDAALAERLKRRYPAAPGGPAEHGVTKVLSTGKPELLEEVRDEVLESVARDEDHLGILRAIGLVSAICTPLLARGRILGCITLFTTTLSGRRYGPADLALAEELSRRAALAVDNARLYQEATRAQESLRHQLHFTKAITENLAEGVCALDGRGRLTFVNPAAEALLGWPAREVLGQHVHDVVHRGAPEADGLESCPLIVPVQTGALARSDNATFRRRDGTPIPVSYAASPIHADGAVVGAVIAFHDIRDRLISESELEASRRQLAMSEKLSALGTLVSGVAHEIRTPLTYIQNNLFLMLHRLNGEAVKHPHLREAAMDIAQLGAGALEGIDRINTLVKDLRPFAHPEPGQRINAGLHEVVHGAIELFRATQRGHAEVTVSLEETPLLQVDKEQVQRVVLNLLINAVEAMPRGGTISIATRPVPGGAELVVADQGPGLSPEVQARMFDPFFTTKKEGTGLGLSITRRIVEAHGGSIRFETKAGEGTTFYIFLPAASQHEPRTVQPEVARHARDPMPPAL